GSERALVVHGMEGLDEISITGETMVSELKDGEVKSYTIGPREFGLVECSIGELEGGDPRENAATALAILQGEKGPRRDVVVLNAAAGIYVGGLAQSIKEGIPLAEGSIDSGRAYGKLKALIERTKSS
ncbi:MAG: anthranilate phosphoribosyltransferase, partial [Chloroflexota bacterium]